MVASHLKSPRPLLFSNNWQLAAVLDKSHIIFNVIYWRCNFNPLLNHWTIKSLPYWSAKGLLLLQKVVWFWSFFSKCVYTLNSLYPAKDVSRMRSIMLQLKQNQTVKAWVISINKIYLTIQLTHMQRTTISFLYISLSTLSKHTHIINATSDI